MNDFDLVLDDCLTQITSGASSLDECLARHPEHAASLRPLLQAAARVERASEVKLSPAFRSRTRAQLYSHMYAHPRRRAWMLPPVWRAATILAMLAIAFVITGTAFAQSALPGQNLYSWKLASEKIWRVVSPDPVSVDLSLASRRVDEMTVIVADSQNKAEALKGYLEVLARLKSEKDAVNAERISFALKSHQEKLSAAGIFVPELDHFIAPSSDSKPSETPVVPTPLPKIIPSPLPKIVPSLVPNIAPTIPILNP